MYQKMLEKGSALAEKLDANGDGVVTDQELMMKERMVRLENQDKKEDQQRYLQSSGRSSADIKTRKKINKDIWFGFQPLQ